MGFFIPLYLRTEIAEGLNRHIFAPVCVSDEIQNPMLLFFQLRPYAIKLRINRKKSAVLQVFF